MEHHFHNGNLILLGPGAAYYILIILIAIRNKRQEVMSGI